MQPHVILNALSAQDIQTVEQWRDVPGSEGRYEVSDHGRVRSWYYRKKWQTTPLYLKSFTSKPGYVYYRLSIGDTSKNYAVHGLVMRVFVGPSSMEPNHKDGDKSNNRLGNLEYMTHKENIHHAIEVLGIRFGIPSGLVVETERDREIRNLAASGIAQREIARRYDISQPYVSYIVSQKVRASSR